MIDEIKKLEACLVNEKIVKFIGQNKQSFKFKLDDGSDMSIGGDRTVKALNLVSRDGDDDYSNLLIESVIYYITPSGILIILINDNIELSFERESGSFIFISFGNTIEYKILT